MTIYQTPHRDAVLQVREEAKTTNAATTEPNIGDSSRYYSAVLTKSKPAPAPARPALRRFQQSEICIGRLLGKGEFGIVYEVDRIEGHHISCTFQPSLATRETDDDALDFSSRSSRMESSSPSRREEGAKQCDFAAGVLETIGVKSGNHKAKYAVKMIRNNLNDEMMATAAHDLALEAKFLASIQHSNIIQMHGSGGVPGSNDFFIVIDRLDGTLDQKRNVWARQRKRARGRLGFKRDQSRIDVIWVECLSALLDVSRALECLHTHRIIFRDLKPQNIGFDAHGTAKLFDFGLAKALTKQKRVGPGRYNLTEMCGTRRYMAPEVALCYPYGLKADVYSFAILMWEIMALKIPFQNCNYESHGSDVVLKGKRPRIPKSWPAPLQKALETGWSKDARKRPTIEIMCDTLNNELHR